MHIISASRRTDIPAFYMDWFMHRLDAGFAAYPNPFGGQIHEVSLRPDDVHSVVFWTKFPAPLLDHVASLYARNIRFMTHVTLTGLPRTLEPHVPQWEHVAAALRTLAARTSPRHVQWRFDPIVITPDLPPAWYAERFAQLAATLEGATTRCYFSFATFYGKVARRMQRAGIATTDPPLDAKRALLDRLADIADAHGITLYACCQDALLGERVQQAHCIDGDLLAALFPDRPHVTTARPTREGCGCVASRDIGIYDTCPYGCAYCYANRTHARAVAQRCRHDPHAAMLIPPASPAPAAD
jgi:DNA repair photolyase